MLYFVFAIGGEELFGLEMTEYPTVQRIRRELGLLQKLYSLYNSVIDNVNGYYDILWQEIDIEKINNELLEYQNRYEDDDVDNVDYDEDDNVYDDDEGDDDVYDCDNVDDDDYDCRDNV